MSYVNIIELKEYLGISGDSDNAILDRCKDAAQQGIDNYCKRTFESSTGSRVYREDDLWDLPDVGGSGNVLWLRDDCINVDALLNADADATEIPSTGYWLEPRNSSGRGRPYHWIRLRTAESWVFGTDGEIEVQGTWGFSTAPDATIKELTLEYAAYLYRLKDSQVFDTVASPDLGIITVPQGMPRHVKTALDVGGYVKSVRFF